MMATTIWSTTMPTNSRGARTPWASTQAWNRSGSRTNRISGLPANQHTRAESTRNRNTPVPAIHFFCRSVRDLSLRIRATSLLFCPYCTGVCLKIKAGKCVRFD